MTNWEVIRWWELRRLLYNVVLLAIGIVSLLGMEFFLRKTPGGEDVIDPFALGLSAVFYGLAANVCYTAGWIMELLARKGNEVWARSAAKKHFVLGLWLSSLLTTAPLWFGLIFWFLHRGR